MTQLIDSNLQEAKESFAKETILLRNHIANLEAAVCSKSEEMSRLRDYYTAIIEKLEE
jgi:hypothetical protein